MFTKIKELNKHILKGNCHAHILHNCVKYAMDFLSLDVENLILKIYSHFSNSAKRREELKSFHKFVNCQWKELIRHVGTRWLSLNPCIERILHNFTALKSYFLSLDDCPKQIVKLLKIDINQGQISPEVEIYLFFCHNILSLFEVTIQKIESNEMTVIDIYSEMQNLRTNLENRLKSKFYGFEARTKLKNLDDNIKTKLELEFNCFLEKAIEYLDKRFDFSAKNWQNVISNLDLKKSFPSYEDFENIFLTMENPNLNINMNDLFNEVSEVAKRYDFISSLDSQFKKFSTPKKWHYLFQHFKEISLPNIFSIVSFFLSIPASSAFSERIFSVSTAKWRDERNRCSTELICAELLITINFKQNCQEFYHLIKNDTELTKSLKSMQKYTFKK